MTTEELIELNAWIGEHVMKATPAMLAYAASADEKGGAMFESATILKRDIKKFCEECPQYHYVERAVWPHYTTSKADAMDVLEVCLNYARENACDTFISKGLRNFWIRTVKGDRHRYGDAESLPLAICMFAKELFT